MTIETKFDVGQPVYYMYKNNVKHNLITYIRIRIFTEPIVIYALHFENGSYVELPENKVFETKEELIENSIK